MPDVVWVFLGTIGAAMIAGIVTIVVAVIKIVVELLGKKNEKTIREMLESYHKDNSNRIDILEMNQKMLENTVDDGFDRVHREIEDVRHTILIYHPREA
jgi:flagellar motor component MotA